MLSLVLFTLKARISKRVRKKNSVNKKISLEIKMFMRVSSACSRISYLNEYIALLDISGRFFYPFF